MAPAIPNVAGSAARGTERVSAFIVAAAAIAAAVGIASFAVLRPEAIPLGFTPAHVAVALVGVGLLFVVVRHPGVALPLLVVFIFLNLSEVMVRFHSLPSLLQLVVIPLFFAAWLGGGSVGLAEVARKRLTMSLALYLAVVLLSTAWARDFRFADERLSDTVKAALLFLLLALLTTSFRRFEQGVIALVGSALFLSVLPILQVALVGFDQEFGGFARIKYAHIYGDVFQPRIAGPLGDPNFFAQILIIALPLAFFITRAESSRRIRIFGWISAAAILAAIVLSYSRGAMLSVLIMGALTVAVIRIRPSTLALAAALAIGGIILLPRGVTERFITIEEILPGSEALHPDSSFQKRRLLTGSALAMFLDNPLIGVGAGNFTTFFNEYSERVGSVSREYEDSDERNYPHNLYLEIGAETGVLGLLAFGAAVVVYFVYTRRSRRRLLAAGAEHYAGLASALEIAMVGFLLSSLFLHGHFIRYLWLLFAAGLSLDRLAQQRETSTAEGS